MQILIITSKNEKGCYSRIIQNWFQSSDKMYLDYPNRVLEVVYKVSKSQDYCVCIPPCVDPDLSEGEKTDIVIDEVLKIVEQLRKETYSFSEKDVYLLLHSGDLFPLGDARRETGLLPLSALETVNRERLKNVVSNENIFQFKHDVNDITLQLLRNQGNEIEELFKQIKDIIEEAQDENL